MRSMLYGLMIFHISSFFALEVDGCVCVRACVRIVYTYVTKGSGKTLIKMQHQDLVEGHNFDIFSLVAAAATSVVVLLSYIIFYCEQARPHIENVSNHTYTHTLYWNAG